MQYLIIMSYHLLCFDTIAKKEQHISLHILHKISFQKKTMVRNNPILFLPQKEKGYRRHNNIHLCYNRYNIKLKARTIRPCKWDTVLLLLQLWNWLAIPSELFASHKRLNMQENCTALHFLGCNHHHHNACISTKAKNGN